MLNKLAVNVKHCLLNKKYYHLSVVVEAFLYVSDTFFFYWCIKIRRIITDQKFILSMLRNFRKIKDCFGVYYIVLVKIVYITLNFVTNILIYILEEFPNELYQKIWEKKIKKCNNYKFFVNNLIFRL